MAAIRVAIMGARGRMGREVLKLVLQDPELELAAIIDPKQWDMPSLQESLGVVGRENLVYPSLSDAADKVDIHVSVDFTVPSVVMANTEEAVNLGIHPVVGATGLTPEEVQQLDERCREKGVGCLVAPNFAIGAILLMRFAAEAAKYLPHVEIIEMHHDQKLDAPSGTALKTAELIAQNRPEIEQGHPKEKETLVGVRGGEYHGFRIHSVRLPGILAHQEVVFGAEGQLLTLRHDALHRGVYMPGVKLGIKAVRQFTGLVYGLEKILD